MKRRQGLGFIALIGVLLLVGCGDPIGTPCKITGSGFTASHNCADKCLYYNKIVCPNGEAVVPKICSGTAGCEPGSCPAGQVCYNYGDPFDEENYCVPADICGIQSKQVLGSWELESKLRAETKRAERAKRLPSTKPSATAMPLQQAPNAESTQSAE